MLRAILAAGCAACLIYSPSFAKKSTGEPIRTSTATTPTGPTDGSLTPDHRFAMAAANTTVLYTASFDSGVLCDSQGWTVVDVQSQMGTFWHVDDFVGVNVNPGDSYAPIAGSKSLWCGLRTATGQTCSYATLPGYGDNWNQAWRTKACIGVVGNLNVALEMRLDTEYGYDGVELEYTSDCDAEYGDHDAWIKLAGGLGEWDGVQNISHVASYNVGAGPVRVRIRFASDNGFSDEDGSFDSHSGPVVIDNLAVEGLAVETFEDEAIGQTSSNDWEADLAPGFGSYFALFPGASLVQQDQCAKNLSCVWAAIAGSTATYACGGFPQQAAVPYGPDTAGQYIRDSIVSPPIAISGTGSRLNLQFSVYRDIAIDNLVVYYWEVRGITNGCPGPWRSHGFVYFGAQKDWKIETLPVGHLVGLASATHVQVRLVVFDECGFYCGWGTPCHSHAPLFDNVKVYRVDIAGPAWSTRDIDMFQDTFPVDGTDTGIGRADAALSITSQASTTILPGDSARVIVSDPITAVAVTNPSGLATDNLGGTGNQAGTNGNKACYLYVHVIDSGVPSGTKTGAVLSGGPSYPFKDTVVADGKTWTRIQCWLRLVNSNIFVVDLNDNLFEAGDEIEFFFGATNTNGETSFCSGSALNYVQSDIDLAAEIASEFTILPLLGNEGILYVDGMDGRGAQVFWDTAFAHLARAPDRYDVRGPTSAVSNRPSTRVVDVNQQLNANYDAIFWDCGDLSVGLGDGTGAPEKSNDYAMINSFLGGLSSMGGVFICGDDAAQSLMAATGASATTFKSSYMTYTLTSGDHRPSFGTSPLLTGDGLGGIYGSQTFVAFGGCPLLNDFDVMAPTGSTTMPLSYGTPAGTNGAVLHKVLGNPRVILAGFSFIYIRDDEADGVMDRAHFLYHTLNVFILPGYQPVDAPPLAVNRLEQNYPNPFNPQTTIAFSIKERGRVRIDVFNVAGERVTGLLDETRAAGSYSDVRWDGTDARGQRVASGVYWYRITTGSFSQSRKMVLLK